MVSGGRKLQSADRQMSEAFITSVFLAMSGGFQDAYTYFTRDEVFSNAQTGNVVLMSQNFMTGQWGEGLRYLFPVLAFAIGVVAAERIQSTFKYAKKLHWRQMILLIEILILFAVGFNAGRIGYAGNRTGILFLAPCRYRPSGRWAVIPMQALCASEIYEAARRRCPCIVVKNVRNS